jgi:hypothetical protein
MKINLDLKKILKRVQSDLEDLQEVTTKEEFENIITNMPNLSFLDWDLQPETREEQELLKELKDIWSDIKALQILKKFY